MPRSSHRPDRPVPVPISTTARAAIADGEEAQRRPHARGDRHAAEHVRGGARIGHHVVLRDVGVDEIGGVGAVHGRRGYWSRSRRPRFHRLFSDGSHPSFTGIRHRCHHRSGSSAGAGREPIGSGRRCRKRYDPPQEVPPHDDRKPRPVDDLVGRAGAARRRRGVDPAELGRGRPGARRPGVPAGLPAVRQPARRRGPHPGDVHPGVPLAADLPARHLRGLAAPHHHQPVPRHGPPPRPHPHGGAAGGLRPHRRARARARSRSTTTPTSTRCCRPRSTRCRRSSAPPSCCATSRVCPTRRSAPRSA